MFEEWISNKGNNQKCIGKIGRGLELFLLLLADDHRETVRGCRSTCGDRADGRGGGGEKLLYQSQTVTTRLILRSDGQLLESDHGNFLF